MATWSVRRLVGIRRPQRGFRRKRRPDGPARKAAEPRRRRSGARCLVGGRRSALGLLGRLVLLVDVQTVVQCVEADAEDLGGRPLVTVEMRERAHDELALDVSYRAPDL